MMVQTMERVDREVRGGMRPARGQGAKAARQGVPDTHRALVGCMAWVGQDEWHV